MADITIDSSVTTTTEITTTNRSLVWISQTTGYIFFVDSGRDLHFRKTTDSGASWGTETTIRTGTIIKFCIWYDKWTKDDTGTIIHIAFVDSDDSDITYNSFSTADDTLDGEVTVLAGTSSGTGDFSTCCVSIVKSEGGNVYCGGWIDPDGENGFLKATQSPATSFASRTSMADGNAVDRIQLLPGNETDTNDIWAIYQDVSANLITLKVYDDSGNSWSESSTIDGIVDNSAFWEFDSAMRNSDGHAILLMWEAHSAILTPDPALVLHDITNITTFSKKTDVFAADDVFGICGLMVNQDNDDIYACYTADKTSGDIVYKLSDDGGDTWGSQTAMSATTDDHRAICGGGTSVKDGGRWMPVWYNDDLRDLITNADNSVTLGVVAAVANIYGYSDPFVSVQYVG